MLPTKRWVSLQPVLHSTICRRINPDGFEYPVLKITQYPLPRKLVEKITGECKEILVLEEGYPVVEEQLKGFLSKG